MECHPYPSRVLSKTINSILAEKIDWPLNQIDLILRKLNAEPHGSSGGLLQVALD
jgi:hypothetical protein